MLSISDDLELPIEAVTQKLAFLGRTGSGKSYGATKLCELMLEAKAQVIALDPVGVWWGLRTGPGKGGGFSILVFGGLHGDIPLDPESGALIADLIVDRTLSAVLDVSQMLISEQHEFVTAFVGQLFQRKKAVPSAMHVFVEECQEFVPQHVGKDETHMVHAFERLIKLGRNFGIGASLISQRPQEVNKKALNQTECLFAFQMTGPHERKAIESWVSEKGAELDIVEVLPKLKVGEPHVWSPQWLGVSKTIRIAKKVTADVSSTPRHGQAQASPQELSSVDLNELRAQMSAAIEKAQSEDPAELQRRIAVLEKENARLLIEARPDISPEDRAWLNEILRRLEDDLGEIHEANEHFAASTKLLSEAAEKLRVAFAQPGPQRNDANTQRDLHIRNSGPPQVSRNAEGRGSASGAAMVTGGLRRMMIALAQRPGLNKRQLGVRAGLSSTSGTFSTYLGKLRSSGWVNQLSDGMYLTRDGLDTLGKYENLPTGQALLDHWLNELGSGSGAARMLRAVADVYPRTLTKEDVGSIAQISPKSGTFSTYLGKLRTLELVQGSKELQANPELFE